MKIVCVYDGGITKDIMSKMLDLEKYGAEVKLIEDKQMTSMAEITDRMLLIEQKGIDAAPINEELLKEAEDADIIVVHVASINREIIDAAKNLKLVAVLRGGIENADIDYLSEKNIPLINAPWRSADAVADFTIGMMIAENKNIARAHKLIFDGKWCKKFANQEYIHNMRNCTVGLIGYGYIGSRVKKRLSGFESRVLVYDPYVDKESIERDGAEYVDLDTLLYESDFVSIHLRLSEETKWIMNKETFDKMKNTAYFINTARSGLVNTNDLIEALEERKIGGAAIDVFDDEPLPTGHPYLSLDNITLTSHLAGTSADTMKASVEIGYDELELFLSGKELNNIKNNFNMNR